MADSIDLIDPILRGLILTPNVEESAHVENMITLMQSSITADKLPPAHGGLLQELFDFFHSTSTCPSFTFLRTKFSADAGKLSYFDLLEKSVPPLYGKQYKAIVLSGELELRKRILQTNLAVTSRIVAAGKEGLIIDKKKYAGVEDAVSYFQQKLRDIRNENEDVIRDLSISADKLREAYMDRKNNRGRIHGVYSGIQTIDEYINGLHLKEMIFLAAYTSEGKTTGALNWVHSGSVVQGFNGLYVSLEMSIAEIELNLSIIHSGWIRAGKPGPLEPWKKRLGLSHRKVRTAKLDPEEEKFYDSVLDSLKNEVKYPPFGHLKIWQPEAKAKSIDDILLQMEHFALERPLDYVVIDHLGLVGGSGVSERERLNQIIRDLRSISLSFANGRGVGFLVLHQISKTGKNHADAHEGNYAMSSLAETIEAARSADVIITFYKKDITDPNDRIIHIGNIKNRNDRCFPAFNIECEFDYKIMQSGALAEAEPTTQPDISFFKDM